METLDKKLDLLKLEEKILDYWKKENIYSLIRKKEEGRETWRLLMDLPTLLGQFILEPLGIRY